MDTFTMGPGRILMFCLLRPLGNVIECSEGSSSKFVGNLTKDKATEVCQSYDMALPGELDFRGVQALTREMKRHGTSTAWTSIQRVRYDSWTATTDGMSGPDVPEFYNIRDNANCALVHGSSGRVKVTSCNRNVNNYLCFLKACTICHHWNCVSLYATGSCITIGRAPVNWFQAKVECTQIGGYLLPFSKNYTDNVGHISNLLEGIEKEAWVGWSMEDWVVQNQSTNALQTFRFSSTSLSGHEDCAVVRREDLMWETEACGSVAPTLCIRKPKGNPTAIGGSPTETPSNPPGEAGTCTLSYTFTDYKLYVVYACSLISLLSAYVCGRFCYSLCNRLCISKMSPSNPSTHPDEVRRTLSLNDHQKSQASATALYATVDLAQKITRPVYDTVDEMKIQMIEPGSNRHDSRDFIDTGHYVLQAEICSIPKTNSPSKHGTSEGAWCQKSVPFSFVSTASQNSNEGSWT